MSDEGYYDDAKGGAPAKKKSGNTAVKVVGLGCLLFIILGCVGAAYVASNAKKLLIQAGAALVKAPVNGSELPQDQKDGINAQIDRLADGFINDKIEQKQFENIVNRVVEGPIFKSIFVYSAFETNSSKLELSDDEKAQAKLAFQRFTRGMVEEQISDEDYMPIVNICWIETDGPGGQPQQKVNDSMSREEFDTFIADMKAAADNAGVPEEEFTPDYAGRVKQIIDEELGATDGQ